MTVTVSKDAASRHVHLDELGNAAGPSSVALANELALASVPLTHLLGELPERLRQAAYDEGYEDALSTVRPPSEPEQPRPAVEGHQPWCVDPADGFDPSDHGCSTGALAVPLTLGVADVRPPYRHLDACVSYYPNDGGTWVEIGRPDQRGYQLTVSETHQLVECLQLLLGQIGAGR